MQEVQTERLNSVSFRFHNLGFACLVGSWQWMRSEWKAHRFRRCGFGGVRKHMNAEAFSDESGRQVCDIVAAPVDDGRHSWKDDPDVHTTRGLSG